MWPQTKRASTGKEAEGVPKVCANHPPEPPVGCERNHSAEFARNPAGYLTHCARSYGDLVSLRLGTEHVVVVYHPRDVEYVMVQGNRNFTKAFKLEYQPILGKGLFMSDGNLWLGQRRLLQPAFQRQQVERHGPTVVAFTERKINGWRDGETRDLHQEMMELLLEISAKTLCGVDDREKVHEIGNALADVNRCIEGGCARQGYLRGWLPGAGNPRLRKAVKRLDESIYALIERRRNCAGDGLDALSMLMGKDQGEVDCPMNDRQLRDELLNLLQAGRETTALALTWTWFLLANDPSAANTLESELDAALGERPPAVADLPRLRFTQAVVMESMRLFPPAAILKRKAIQKCEIGGYGVPRGTSIMLPICVVQRDPRFFDEPDCFRPARWTEGLQERLPRFAYFPFGGGPRQCIGKAMAMMIAVLVVATIARRFQFHPGSPEPVELWPAVTLRPQHGVKLVIKCKPRDRQERDHRSERPEET
jgi:cytochrome P450